MKTIKLTDAEINHLLSLINSNDIEGSYYRPKEQYWARSERIKNKLTAPTPKGDQ